MLTKIILIQDYTSIFITFLKMIKKNFWLYKDLVYNFCYHYGYTMTVNKF